MSSAHEKRIDALERQAGMLDTEALATAEARATRFVALWEELVTTMAAEHRAIIYGDIDAGQLCRWPDGSILGTMRGHALTSHASRLVLDRCNGKLQGPLALPTVIGDALVTYGQDLSFLHDCEVCGFMVPLVSGWQRIGLHSARYATSRRLFDACPLCGGHVGYAAYFTKHGHHGWDAATMTDGSMSHAV